MIRQCEVYTGILKPVPTEKQQEAIENGRLSLESLNLKDAVINQKRLFIRILVPETTYDGELKYRKTESGEFEQIFKKTLKFQVEGNALKALLKLENGDPVRVVVEHGCVYWNVICVQDNR